MNSSRFRWFAIGIVVVFVLVFFGASMFFQQKNKEGAPPAPVVARPTGLPSIDRSIGIAGAPISPQITIAPQKVDVPQQLPVYRVAGAYDQIAFRTIASSLGFTGEPRILSERNPLALGWQGSGRDLTGRIGVVSQFSLREPHRELFPAQPSVLFDTQPLFSSFVSRHSLLPPVISIKANATDPIRVNDRGEPSLVPTQQYALVSSFLYHLDNYRLYLRPVDIPDATVFLDSSGNMYRISLLLSPRVITKQDDRPVAVPAVAAGVLLRGGGILVGVEGELQGSSEQSIGPNFSEVTITENSLVYFLLENENLIVPAYLFTGVAPNESGRGSLTVKYLVRATN